MTSGGARGNSDGDGRALQILRLAGVIVFSVLIGVILLGAIARYFSIAGVEWSFEVAQIAFIWVIFIGTVIAELEHQNVGFNWLEARSTGLFRKVLSLISAAVLLAVAGFLAFSAYLMVGRTLTIPTPVLRISSAISPTALLFAAIALVIVAVLRIARRLS